MGLFLSVVCFFSYFMPILRIYGSSMSPTLTDGDIVITMKTQRTETGDILVFDYNGKTLIRRCIAKSGDWVNIDTNGNVFVNNTKVNEPYTYRKAVGECDITFPYQVPENTLFVMGDNRGISLDSRLREIGCVSKEQVQGKMICIIFPLRKFKIG